MFRSRHETALFSLLLTTLSTAPTARAQQPDLQPPLPQDAPNDGPAVYLFDVSINHWPLGLIGRFVRDWGRLRIPAEQFDGLGFVVDPGMVVQIQGERWIWLDTIPGLAWTTDERAQTLDFTARPELLKTTRQRVSPGVRWRCGCASSRPASSRPRARPAADPATPRRASRANRAGSSTPSDPPPRSERAIP